MRPISPRLCALTGDTTTLAAFERRFAELRRTRRLTTALGLSLLAALFVGSAVIGNFSPAALIAGAPKLGEYVQRTLPALHWSSLGADLAYWFYGLRKWLELLLETVLMAYLATLLGSVGSSAAVLLRFEQFVTQSMELPARAPDRRVLPHGPRPRLRAGLRVRVRARTTAGNSGYCAAFPRRQRQAVRRGYEEHRHGPVDGLRAAGANWIQTMRFAVLPQVLPNYALSVLWRFEINVRTAAVMGFVGAGGIGMELITAVRSLYYEDISAILILIVLTVSLIDIGCEKLRHAWIGREALE